MIKEEDLIDFEKLATTHTELMEELQTFIENSERYGLGLGSLIARIYANLDARVQTIMDLKSGLAQAMHEIHRMQSQVLAAIERRNRSESDVTPVNG